MPLLENHIAVVTGAASGIGRAIAAGFAREGARMALLDIDEKAAAEANASPNRSVRSRSWSTMPASTAATPSPPIPPPC